MSARSIYPSAISVAVTTTARVTKTTRPGQLDGLRPFRLRVFDAPDYRMRDGFPIAVPDFDVRADHLISASGERLAYRPFPREITTAANARWVADPDFYDDVTFSWLPIYSDLGPITWDSSDVYGPTLINDYVYSINKERFTVTAMNFDRDGAEHFWTTANALTGSQGFTVIMVCTMNSAFGNTQNAGYSGIFGSGLPTGAYGMQQEFVDNDFGVQLVNNTIRVVMDDKTAGGMKIAGLMSRAAPMYLVLAMGMPSSVIYAGKGPQDLQRTEVISGTSDEYFFGDFVLGRSYGDTLHTADMAIMDLGIYADKLTPTQVRAEVALLSSVYGGQS